MIEILLVFISNASSFFNCMANSGKSNKLVSRARNSSSNILSPRNPIDILGRELPHNIDAEAGLIASMILNKDGEVMNTCIASKLREEYFYKASHRKIFSAILELYNENKDIEEIILAEKLDSKKQLDEIGGVEEINRIAGRIETSAHFKHWLDIVKEKYFLRTLISTCNNTVESAYKNEESLDVFLEDVESKILAISQDRVTDSAKRISEKVDEAIALINNMIKYKDSLSGISTGFTDLDKLTQGLHGNEMIVLAGRPGTGKTSLALNIAEAAVFAKIPVPTLIFSLEMESKQLVMRMICSRAEVNQHNLRRGFVSDVETPKIQKAGAKMMDAPLWIDDSPDMNILEMRAKARRLKQHHNIGLIIVDYLQLMKAVDSRVPREQQVAEMSRGMKAMAKELGVPVIVLAQLNRETEKDNRDPRASDLRESGSIEQDADVILLLSWERKSAKDGEDNFGGDQKLVKLLIAKQRSGPTGTVQLLFRRNFTKYVNYLEDTNEVR